MTDKMKTAINSAIEDLFYLTKNEDGTFSDEIFADYRDEMDVKTAIEILQSEHPEERLNETLFDWYAEILSDCESEIINDIKEEISETLSAPPSEDEEREIEDYIRDIVHLNLPEGHYLKQEFRVNIMVDTGDGNHDFTLNPVYPCYYGDIDEDISDKAAIVWLTKEQGYSKEALSEALKHGDIKDPKGYLESMRQEMANLSTGMATLTFLAKMSLEDLIKLNSLIRARDEGGVKYDATKYPDCGYITIDKKAEAGLYNPWGGGGSVFEIELEKDIKLPIKFIRSALPDGGDGYSIDSVYGMCGSCWRDVVKEIHGISDERLGKESAV